jgi:hypothetical protein
MGVPHERHGWPVLSNTRSSRRVTWGAASTARSIRVLIADNDPLSPLTVEVVAEGSAPAALASSEAQIVPIPQTSR